MSFRRALWSFWTLVTVTCALQAAGVPMPWNAGLTALGGNLTGPTALGLTLGGAAVTFAPMIFHGEIPQWGHRAGYVALVGGTLLAIPALIGFFGIGGALV